MVCKRAKVSSSNSLIIIIHLVAVICNNFNGLFDMLILNLKVFGNF